MLSEASSTHNIEHWHYTRLSCYLDIPGSEAGSQITDSVLCFLVTGSSGGVTYLFKLEILLHFLLSN